MPYDFTPAAARELLDRMEESGEESDAEIAFVTLTAIVETMRPGGYDSPLTIEARNQRSHRMAELHEIAVREEHLANNLEGEEAAGHQVKSNKAKDEREELWEQIIHEIALQLEKEGLPPAWRTPQALATKPTRSKRS